MVVVRLEHPAEGLPRSCKLLLLLTLLSLSSLTSLADEIFAAVTTANNSSGPNSSSTTRNNIHINTSTDVSITVNTAIYTEPSLNTYSNGSTDFSTSPSIIAGPCRDPELPLAPRVWPTIRANPRDGVYRLVQINWEIDEVLDGDWVGVFSNDPTSITPTKVYTEPPASTPSPSQDMTTRTLLMVRSELPNKNFDGNGGQLTEREIQTPTSSSSNIAIPFREGRGIQKPAKANVLEITPNSMPKGNIGRKEGFRSTTTRIRHDNAGSSKKNNSSSSEPSPMRRRKDQLKSEKIKFVNQIPPDLGYPVHIRHPPNKVINGKRRETVHRRRKPRNNNRRLGDNDHEETQDVDKNEKFNLDIDSITGKSKISVFPHTYDGVKLTGSWTPGEPDFSTAPVEDIILYFEDPESYFRKQAKTKKEYKNSTPPSSILDSSNAMKIFQTKINESSLHLKPQASKPKSKGKNQLDLNNDKKVSKTKSSSESITNIIADDITGFIDEDPNTRLSKSLRRVRRMSDNFKSAFNRGVIYDHMGHLSRNNAKNKVIIQKNEHTDESRFGGGFSASIDRDKPILSTSEGEENRFGGGFGSHEETFKENITVIKDPDEEHRFGAGVGVNNSDTFYRKSNVKKQVTNKTINLNSTDEDKQKIEDNNIIESNAENVLEIEVTTINYKVNDGKTSNFTDQSMHVGNETDTQKTENITANQNETYGNKTELKKYQTIFNDNRNISDVVPKHTQHFFRIFGDINRTDVVSGNSSDNEKERDFKNNFDTDEQLSKHMLNMDKNEVAANNEIQMKENNERKKRSLKENVFQNVNTPSVNLRMNASEGLKSQKYEFADFDDDDSVLDLESDEEFDDSHDVRNSLRGKTSQQEVQENPSTLITMEPSKSNTEKYDTSREKNSLVRDKERKHKQHNIFDYPTEDVIPILEQDKKLTYLNSPRRDKETVHVDSVDVGDEHQSLPKLSLKKEHVYGVLVTVPHLRSGKTLPRNGTDDLWRYRSHSAQVSSTAFSGPESDRGEHSTGWSRYHPWVLFSALPTSTEGKLTSTVSHPRVPSSVLAEGGCVGVWIGYVRRGRVLAVKCVEAHPAWMWDNREMLLDRPMQSLALLGSHNVGSLQVKDESSPLETWIVCQDETVLDQLLYGIRYLDVRVGYYPDTVERLWVNHDMVRWAPLSILLEDIVAFTRLSPDPLIVDIHRTPVGFELPEARNLLIEMLQHHLSALVFSPTEDDRRFPTLGDMWTAGRSVVVSWGDWDARRDNPWLWPPIPQAWANAQIVSDLRSFLTSQTNTYAKYANFWAAMGHLTPSFWDIMLRGNVGVRGLADKVSPMLWDWLRGSEWRQTGKVLAVDFFHSCNLIENFININIARATCPEVLKKKQTATTVTPTTTMRSIRSNSLSFAYTDSPLLNTDSTIDIETRDSGLNAVVERRGIWMGESSRETIENEDTI